MAINLHPIFDPDSEFRRFLHNSLAADGGQSTVRQYFEMLRRRQLREAWQYVDPPAPQEWGLGVEVDRAIHQQLLISRKQARQTPTASLYLHAAGGGRQPALLIYDLNAVPIQALVPQPLRKPESLFSGIGKSRVEIDTFGMGVGGLPANRECLAIILKPSILERLSVLVTPRDKSEEDAVSTFLSGKGKCPTRVADDDKEVVGIVSAMLDAATLEPVGTERIPNLRADVVNLQLSLTPVFTACTRTTNRAGEFQVSIPLDRPSPISELGTYVLICLGPDKSNTAT